MGIRIFSFVFGVGMVVGSIYCWHQLEMHPVAAVMMCVCGVGFVNGAVQDEIAQGEEDDQN